jgi:hypothetical protein
VLFALSPLRRRASMYGESDSREGLVQSPTHPYLSSVPRSSQENADQGASTTAVATAQAEKLPFYKRRWFIISSFIGVFFGIPLLFIILFPVLKVIAQSIVDKAALNIQTSAIQVPQNTTYVFLFLLSIKPRMTPASVSSFIWKPLSLTLVSSTPRSSSPNL